MQRRILAGLAAAVAAACGPAAAPTPARPGPAVIAPPAPVALPLPPPVAPAELGDDVTPVAYRLELELDPAAPGFRGAIEIDVTIARATRAIWLHAAPELMVTPIAVTRAGQPIAIDRLVPASAGGVLGVALRAPLAPGPATLRFELAGDYRGRDGIFAQTSGGARFVFTDFEPVDARRAFPCFDLPRWRAPWTITVRAPDGVGAYANTAETSQTREGDLIAHQFATTAPLPTYLVAIAVGRFTVVDVPGAPIPARILVPGPAGGVALAASLVGPVLDATSRTIGRPIPWAKLDLVVVPELSGAMENPGLITISSAIAVAPASPDARRLLALVIAHELAHLWFGDWVTVTSWRELWLNEGIASWLADRTLSAMTPAWRVPLERVGERLDAFVDDRIADIHPLRPRVITEPRALFDRLSYDKGAAVIHGLDAWLGPEPVRAALADHLDRHAWGAAGSEALIASLATIDPALPIAEVVNDAINLPGVPTVAAEVDCASDRATLTLRAVEAPRRVVVCARWGGAAAGRACAVVSATPTPIALGATCPAWVIPDDDGAGYYRWQLPARWWTALATAPLTATERRTAIEAAIAALAAGQLDLAGAAAVLAPAIATADRRLLEPAARWVRLLAALAPAQPRAAFAKRIGAAADRALATLGRAPIANEDPDRARARAVALELAGAIAGDRQVVRWADKTAAAWLRGALQPEPITAAALVVVGARGKPGRRRQLVAAARRGGHRVDAVAGPLGRALAPLPDATLAPLLAPSADPPTPLQQALIGALLEDPDRAAATLATLGDRAPLFALFTTAVPCAVAPPPPRPPAAQFAAALTRLRGRLAVTADQCQALVARRDYL